MGSSVVTQSSGATDDAVSLTANSGTAVAKDAGIALASGATLATGTRVTGSNLTNSNVYFGETGLGETFAQTVRDLTETNNAALTALVQNQSQANLPSPAKELATEEETEEETGKKTGGWWLWGAALAALLALFYLFKRR